MWLMMILRVANPSVGNDLLKFRKFGVTSELADGGREAIAYLKLYDYDLALIDQDLADIPGSEVVRLMRAAGNATPAVILAPRADARKTIVALDQGADDVIVQPCDKEILLARLRAVVRRSHGHAHSSLRVGPVEIRLDRREVRVNGQRLPLTRREFAILELLFLKQGTVLNKSSFLNHLYCGTEEPQMKAIDVNICRLRRKLTDAGAPDLIATVWGCGYILRDVMDVVPTESAHESVADTVPEAALGVAEAAMEEFVRYQPRHAPVPYLSTL
jgi:two-component system cell cycle response regulator CtrA